MLARLQIVSGGQIKRIVTKIKNCYPLTPDCEITLEDRVNRFSSQAFEASLEAGINRFSFGVQRVDTFVRKKAKRLDYLLSLLSGAHGVDLYQLIETQGTPMEKLVAQGSLPMPADTQTKASMYAYGVAFMAEQFQRRRSVNH